MDTERRAVEQEYLRVRVAQSSIQNGLGTPVATTKKPWAGPLKASRKQDAPHLAAALLGCLYLPLFSVQRFVMPPAACNRNNIFLLREQHRHTADVFQQFGQRLALFL